MYAPATIAEVAAGLNRPGQAGPDPGDYFKDGGGPVITNVHVVPIFWGSEWNDNNNPNPSVLQVYAALASIVSGPYMTGLAQYRGVGKGQIWLASGTRASSSEPPNPFTDSNISNLVASEINAGSVPSPTDLPGNQYLYTVFLPPGVKAQNGAGGEHTYFTLNGNRVHFAWCTHGSGLDSISNIFSHELAEACSDPEGSGFTFSSLGDPGYSGWIEIGDVCEGYSARLNGVEVQAYWSQKDQACIIPTLNLAPIPRWYRMGDQSVTHGILNGGISLATDGHGQMHLFARGTGSDMLELRETGSPIWGNYTSMGGSIDLDCFSVGVNGDGRLEVFALGGGNAVYHNWETSPGGGWSGWNSMGGVAVGVPKVARNANGQLEVFVVGSDSAVWHIKQAGSADWGKAWVSLGGKVLTGLFVPPILDVIANADGRLEVFAQGTDAGLYHIWQQSPNGSSGWSSWAQIGGQISLLSLARAANGQLSAFVRGGDGALYMIQQNNTLNWGGAWTRLGGSMAGTSFSAGVNADGRIEVFWQGSDNSAQHIWQNSPNAPPSGWSGIQSLGGGIQKITVANNADGRFELAVVGMDSWVYHLWQTAPSNGWNY